jgi:hypothetical protein
VLGGSLRIGAEVARKSADRYEMPGQEARVITYLRTEDVPLADLAEHPDNARVSDVEAIRASVRRFGQYRSIVARVAEGSPLVCLAGWHTSRAMLAEDYATGRLELIECTEDEARAIVAADNRLPELATYDQTRLAALTGGLSADDLAATGWTAAALADALAVPPPPPRPRGDRDAMPDVPPPTTRLGEVWVCGAHRVMCGDGTQPEDVTRLLGGVSPVAMITDPPYCSGGFQEAGRAAGSIGTERADGIMPKIANDTLSTRGYMALMKATLGLSRCSVAYVFTDWRMWVNLFDVAESSGFGVRNMIVWNKDAPGMGVGWRSQHELVMFASRAGVAFDPHKAQGNVRPVRRVRDGDDRGRGRRAGVFQHGNRPGARRHDPRPVGNLHRRAGPP